MTIVAYARVSTQEQAENSNALKQQIDRLRSAGAEEIFYDVESGANPERPEFNKLLKLARQGKVDTIIATRWDRLTRNDILYLQLKQLLQEHNVKLRLLDQGEVDFSTASGELSADMQAILAIHERRMLKERVKRGYEYRRKRKAACQRPPWGYLTKDEQYVLNTQPIVCLLVDRPENYQEIAQEPDDSPLLVVGLSKSDIAKEAIAYFFQVKRPRKVLSYLHEKYGVNRKKFIEEEEFTKKKTAHLLVLTEELLFWNSGQNFAHWLQNPVLRGHTAYRKYDPKKRKRPSSEWDIHENTHPDQRLLTEENFKEVQVLLKSNRKKVGAPGSKLYLTGLILCHECGHKCVLKRSPKYGYYGCRNSTVGCHNHKCIRLEALDEAIIREFFLKATSLSSNIIPLITQEKEEKESPEITELKNQLEGLENLLKSNPNEILKRAKHELMKELENLSNQTDVEDFSKATAEEILSHPHATHLGFWYTLTLQEREIIYEKLIKKVTIFDGKVIEVTLTL